MRRRRRRVGLTRFRYRCGYTYSGSHRGAISLQFRLQGDVGWAGELTSKAKIRSPKLRNSAGDDADFTVLQRLVLSST